MDLPDICVSHHDNKTILKINGNYEIIGFFPDTETINMVIVMKRKEDKMDVKIYSPWAFTENEKEKSKINYEIFKELKQKYKIYRNGMQIDLVDGVDLNFDDYDVIIGRNACYLHGEYKVYKNIPKLSNDELALLCDDGNLCFGYKYEGESNGIKKFYVSED